MKTKNCLIVAATFLLSLLLITQQGCKKEKEDEPQNSPPTIQSITSTPNTSSSNRLPAGEQVIITVTATDPDKDNLSYTWEADGGNFVGQTSQSSVTWQSPMSTSEENYKITATVSDGAKTTSESITIYVDNATPGINAIPKTFDFGTTETEFQVKVFNTGNGQLKWETYLEGASWLTVNPNSGTVSTPNDTSYVTLTIDREGMSPDNYSEDFRFKNSDDNTNYVSISVSMEVAETASLEGYVYYASTTIPVSGVLVVVGENSSTTGSDGFYNISDVLTGNHTLTATKEGYDIYSTNIQVSSGNNELDIEITSALYTHNLFGTITDELTGTPISFVNVIVLNPDGTESDLKTQSSSSGYYQVPTVPQGERTVKFLHNDYDSSEINIFMANSDYELDFQLMPSLYTDTYTDPRDGKTYNIAGIYGQVWFAENLNYQTGNSWCYDDDPANCDIYGRLYDWNTALTACPGGWHLPSDDEWKILEMHLGMSQSAADQTGWRGTDEGGKLKETGLTHWNSPNTGATNSSGFTALPGGYRNSTGSFYYLGGYGHWWSSTEASGASAWRRHLAYDYQQVRRHLNTKPYGFSVRCLKN